MYARKITGPKASQREVMRERGRIDRRMRSLLRFEPKWRLYPEHRLSELLSVLDHERSIAERFAAARAPGAAQPELPLKKN